MRMRMVYADGVAQSSDRTSIGFAPTHVHVHAPHERSWLTEEPGGIILLFLARGVGRHAPGRLVAVARLAIHEGRAALLCGLATSIVRHPNIFALAVWDLRTNR